MYDTTIPNAKLYLGQSTRICEILPNIIIPICLILNVF